MLALFKNKQHFRISNESDAFENWVLFIHSMSIIGFQIVLMRILSINQWDHFANMIIGIAMLGFGVSGSLIAVFKQKLLKHATTLIPLFMILSSVGMLAAYRISQFEFIRFDTFLVFSSLKQVFKLVLFVFLFFLPFLAASLAIGLIYVRNVSGIGTLYFSNLIGSGLGGIAGLATLHFLLPQDALAFIAIYPALAAVFLIKRTNKNAIITSYVALLVLLIANMFQPVQPAMSQYKSLAKALKLPDAEILVNEKGITSQVHIIESDFLRYAPGLSLHFSGVVPVVPMAFANGNAAGFLLDYNADDVEILNYSTFSLPFVLSQPSTVAVISGGTGELATQAVRNGARHIDVFETDIVLLRAIESWRQKGNSAIYAHDAVNVHRMQARSYLQRTNTTYDLIVLPTVGSFGGSSGINALKENYELTLESLNIYWQKLSDDGLMTITAYTDFPPRATIKVLHSLAELLRQQGLTNPEEHIAAVRSWTAITFVVSKQQLSEQYQQHITDFADELGFDPFLLPGIDMEDRIFYNYMDDNRIFDLSDAIMEGNTEELASYPFYVLAASDNKPFFSRYLKLSGLRDLTKEFQLRELPFLELGYLIVWLTFIIALTLSALFILWPVSRFKKTKGRLNVLLYFGSIGLGFMFAEIILIQKFILYFGQPVFAVSAVLSIMLIASGAGSYVSGKIKSGSKTHQLSLVIISATLVLYAFFLTDILSTSAGAPVPVKIFIALLVVGLPAFFMGLPFPLGLKSLTEKHSEKIAWAWGINGFFSVIATPLALIIAVEAGAFLVIFLAASAYLMALLAMISFFRTFTTYIHN